MTAVLPSIAAVGMLMNTEKFFQKWELCYNWPYRGVLQTSRRSYIRSLQLYHSHSKNGLYRGCGNRGLKLPSSLPRNHGHFVFLALSKFMLSDWMNGRLVPTSCSPIQISRSFLREREASIIVAEAEEETDVEDSDDEVDHENAIEETLEMFEWPAICAQVAQFACTPMGISIAKEGNLAIGANKVQSEGLLEHTVDASALSEPLNFFGIEDVQGLLAEVMRGTLCEINDLCRVKNTLIGIQSVHDQLCDRSGTYSLSSNAVNHSSLQAIMADCDLCSDLVGEINHCLDCAFSTVLDKASPGLAATRLSRQENMRALETLLKETAARVVQHGGMDSVVVTPRRTRLCIAVRSSHKSLLPGGVTLDVSNTGKTCFIEPEPAVRLNNEESRLAATEKAEEIAVLKRLTLKLVDKADSIMDLLGRITVVDLACARASHARWLGSVCPMFHEAGSTLKQDVQGYGRIIEDGEKDDWMVDIAGMRHPLLLGAVLPNLPGSQRYGTLQSSTSLKNPSLKAKAADSSDVSKTLKLPVPIDILVKAEVKVVTITGPNTGGKTATLKAFGVAAIMAKAGLFLPAVGQPKLPWFDMVLADVGDSQSLERSLSTFSGHIRRLCSILELCTDQSFILLDEIGGGTDPSEGAALATAVLQHLRSKVWLTIATTHSAELKTLKDHDPSFENASVEFDVVTLKPTYRVLWGLAGQSNALDIAASLGFDQKILGRAREMVGKLLPSQLGARAAEVLEPLMRQREVLLERSGRAADVLFKAQELHHELKAVADNLPKQEAAQKKLEERAIQSDIALARLRIDQVIERFQEAMDQEEDDSCFPSVREVHAEIESIVEEFTLKQGSVTSQEPFPRAIRGLDQASGAETLAVGDKVIVRKLGKAPVTVIQVPRKGADFVTLQFGTLKMQVKSKEVHKIRTSESAALRAKPKKVYKVSKFAMSKTNEVGSSVARYEVAVQTSRNTLELRGMRVEDALRELNTTLASKRPKSVVFVIHGIGTGAVKEAVLQTLRQHPFVAKFEEESISNQGCTIVYIK